MLIPPSLLLIIYGVLAEQSIGRMFIAGLVPGAFRAAGFVIWIMLVAKFAPRLVFTQEYLNKKNEEHELPPAMPVSEILRKLSPIVVLVLFVLGGLYSGFFTPTEAGGVGAFAALIIALLRSSLDLRKWWQVLTETGTISVGILALLVAASFYSQMLAVAGIPSAIGSFVQNSGFGPVGFLVVYVILVLLLGMILTPPFGISIFTVHSTLGDKNTSLESIFVGAFPYVVVMLIVLILVAVFPGLVIG